MSMQYPRKARLSRLLAALLAVSATYFLMLAITGADSPAPWLSDDDGGSGDPGIGVLVGLVTGSGAAGVYLVLRACLRRPEPQSGRKRLAWRYSELSRREKRRLATALTVSSSALSLPFAFAKLQGGGGGPVFWIFVVSGTLGTVIGVVMVLVQVRPSRTVMQIVEERTRHDAKIVLSLLAEARVEDARRMDQWKEEAAHTLYSEIMRQVEEGLITCQKCEELGSAHLSAPKGIPQVPEPRCECSGPTSIPVIIYPNRFQHRKNAS